MSGLNKCRKSGDFHVAHKVGLLKRDSKSARVVVRNFKGNTEEELIFPALFPTLSVPYLTCTCGLGQAEQKVPPSFCEDEKFGLSIREDRRVIRTKADELCVCTLRKTKRKGPLPFCK